MEYKKFKVISEKVIIDTEYANMVEQAVEFPDGKKGVWYVNKKIRDGVFVLPQLKDGRFVLEQIYRHGADKVLYECVGGGIEDGEAPEVALQRETEEELGLKLGELVLIGTSYAGASRSAQKAYFYYAKDCELLLEKHPESAEQIGIVICDTEESVMQKLLHGESGSTSMALWACYQKYKHETA